MRTLTYQLRDLKKFMICIGFEDENNRTQVRIDCGEVFAEYPNAAVTMKVQAPKGGIYPATVTREDNVILWTVRDCDVANKGSGEFQLTFTDGETAVKTCVGKFHVDRSLKGSGTAPSGVQDWLDHAEDVLDQVESAEIHQPMIGLDGYWYKWNQEAGEYVSTGTKAQGQDGQPGQPGQDGQDGTDATPDLITKDYADLTFPVAKDSFCYHDGKLYQAKQAIQTSEQWTAAHWQETTVEEKITDIKNAIVLKTPEQFGAKGDGVTDDSAAIQAAVDAGYEIRFADNKTYSIETAITINHDVKLIGGKNTKIKTNTPSGGQTNRAFFINGTLKKETTLTSNYSSTETVANRGDRFKLTDMEGINVGDIMVITAEDQFFSLARDYYYLGGTLLVCDVTDDYIFTCDALPFDIENTENVSVKIYSAPEVLMENLNIVSDLGTVGEYIYMVNINHCKNITVKNCSIADADNGIRISECVNSLVDNLTVSKMPLSGTGRALDHYGIAIYSCTNTTIDRVMGNAANSCIDLSGTIPNLNTRIMRSNLFALSRHDGLGMHENAFNTVVEDCVIGGFLAFGTVTVNRCRFIRSYRNAGEMSGISFRGTHRKEHGRLVVTNCSFESGTSIQIPKPYTQDNPQPFNHVIDEIIVENCDGGYLQFTPSTDTYVLSNTINYMKLLNWKNCYEFYHTSDGVIGEMLVKNCEFSAKRWINDHENHLAVGSIGALRVLNDCKQEDKLFVEIAKNGAEYNLPAGVKINFTPASATDLMVVCGKNVASNKPTDLACGTIGGDVGQTLTRSKDNSFSSALSVNANDEIVLTQPNNTTKISVYPLYYVYVPKNRVIKLSCKLKNTGETTGATFRPNLAVIDCGTGKITYRNNNGTVQATTEGAIATHQRDIDADSLVVFFLYCNSPVANAVTTFSDFVVEVMEYGFNPALTFEKYDGNTVVNEGSVNSIAGINHIFCSKQVFGAKFSVDFMDY